MSPRPARVLITHPGRQHSHQAALALREAGLLAGYWSGVPTVERHLNRLPGRLLRPFVRYPPLPLEPELVRWAPLAPTVRRATDALLPRSLAQRADLYACRAFDRWAARRLGRVEAGAVIACEISALTTFRAARRRGWATLLDAPSFHHAAQDRLHGFAESPRLHARIVAVKDREIELADHVLTVSELARRTYLDAGLAPERVHAVPLGADLEMFRPGDPPSGPGVTFLFAGASIRRKGFDLLVAAFEGVLAEARSARLRIVGPRGELGRLADALDPSAVTVVGPVTQEALARELRLVDCLVLPSRNDSFGMVVAESLASGTPVVVSEMVGAKDLVREGASGWIVPVEDAAALGARMLACAREPEALRAMRPAAREAAAEATWAAYHRRFGALIAGLLAEEEAGS